MSRPTTDPDPAGDSALRFALKMQSTRGVLIAASGVLALLCTGLGLLESTPRGIVELVVAGVASAALLYAYLRSSRKASALVDVLWIAVDVISTTMAVHITGGASSPWFVWYLAVLSATAFVSSPAAVAVVSVANIAGYLGILVASGDITGVDGTLYPPLLRIAFLHAAAVFFILGVIDLKEKRATIRKLRDDETRKVEELERLTAALDERSRELSERNVVTDEANRMKSRFLANMSHELRTPLNAIIGFSEILLSRAGKMAPDKQLRFLTNINGSGLHLLGLINDILDLSKIESGKMELSPERFDVKEAVEGVATIMKGMSTQREVSLSTDVAHDLPALEADPVRFKQILYNLASNAVKFSPKGSTVTITARRFPAAESRIHADALELSVKDQGIGIDPKDHALVFEEFRQADDGAARQHEGTGLGLTLVKRFVELHRGAVGLESALGQGSTFTVTLPYRFQRPGRNVPSSGQIRPISSDRKRSIVVVEDDPESYAAISAPLVRAGYLPVRARHGQEALDLVRKLHPVAVTLDLALPGLDGWEVLRSLKSDATVSGIPVLIVSMSDNRDLGLTLGADDYFVKPIDQDRFLRRLAELTAPAATAPGPATVLVIDDDRDARALIEEVLTANGYRVLQAGSGKEGIARAVADAPRLIVLDLMMEGMDGFDVATELRRDQRTAAIPIVVLTAMDVTARDLERLRGKVSGLMKKGPGGAEGLVAHLDDLLRRRPPETGLEARP